VFPPGHGCRYCNVGYDLVGLAIEAVTGFGLEFVIDGAGMVRNIYKDGANAGASGIVRYYPADQLDLVVLSNSADGAWPAIDEIHRLIRADNPSIGESGVGFR